MTQPFIPSMFRLQVQKQLLMIQLKKYYFTQAMVEITKNFSWFSKCSKQALSFLLIFQYQLMFLSKLHVRTPSLNYFYNHNIKKKYELPPNHKIKYPSPLTMELDKYPPPPKLNMQWFWSYVVVQSIIFLLKKSMDPNNFSPSLSLYSISFSNPSSLSRPSSHQFTSITHRHRGGRWRGSQAQWRVGAAVAPGIIIHAFFFHI